MCNLYAQTRSQTEIRTIANVVGDRTGNLAPQPAIFPDSPAPVVRTAGGDRELVMMRWGIPGPAMYKGPPITNVRNTASNHWLPMLRKPAQRCLVPATSFSEYEATPDPVTNRKPVVWFALSEDRPLFFFAGIWRAWQGTRGTKKEPVVGDHRLFSFLTCEPNAIVKPIHPKAMPVILTTPDEWKTWLEAPIEEALELQRPLPDHLMQIVKRGIDKGDEKSQTPQA